ncbi:hypothetical protein [Martelella soudanensis]|uniref:hypothetical protein n=1 Tax=unclassified Martelella TaxID=2629616 RepID=UPI0015DEE885|nr:MULTISPECIES: hypothetical protein [unclassified Martelella]
MKIGLVNEDRGNECFEKFLKDVVARALFAVPMKGAFRSSFFNEAANLLCGPIWVLLDTTKSPFSTAMSPLQGARSRSASGREELA